MPHPTRSRQPAILSLILACLVLCSFWVLHPSAALGQEVVPPVSPPVATVPKPSPSPELEEIMVHFRLGQNEELIEKATLALAKTENPDPHILYWRGYAERRIGWLDAAEKDLAPLGDFAAWPKFPLASKLAADVGTMLALRPPIEHEVRLNGKVVFRVYTTADTPFSANVIASLPKGYQAASLFIHKEGQEIPVFIFNEDQYDRFVPFFTLLRGIAPHNWWRILSAAGSITISQRNGLGDVIAPDVAWFPKLLTHEMGHILIGCSVGAVRDFPNWFNEGAAEMVAASLYPTMNQLNDQKIQLLLQQGALLPLDQITSHANFHDSVDQSKDGRTKSDPYSQGLNMTRYLGFLLKGQKFSDFLATMKQKGSFEATVKETTGLTMPQFYDSWLKAIQPK